MAGKNTGALKLVFKFVMLVFACARTCFLVEPTRREFVELRDDRVLFFPFVSSTYGNTHSGVLSWEKAKLVFWQSYDSE